MEINSVVCKYKKNTKNKNKQHIQWIYSYINRYLTTMYLEDIFLLGYIQRMYLEGWVSLVNFGQPS